MVFLKKTHLKSVSHNTKTQQNQPKQNHLNKCYPFKCVSVWKRLEVHARACVCRPVFKNTLLPPLRQRKKEKKKGTEKSASKRSRCRIMGAHAPLTWSPPPSWAPPPSSQAPPPSSRAPRPSSPPPCGHSQAARRRGSGSRCRAG